MISGEGKRFNRTMVARIRSNYDLEARYSRLRARGMLTLAEIAKRLDISAATAKTWRRAGLLRSHRYNERRKLVRAARPEYTDKIPVSAQKSCKLHGFRRGS
jgi:transposase